MYNKIFTKILDSSIWLEPTTTRVVWLTFIAAMDEDGFTQFASVANLAHRARVTPEECEEAVKCLESPDLNSSDPDHEGRRIERVPGGWMILNASKYRDLVTRTVSKEQTRIRVARFREKKKRCNGEVTTGNDGVTPSEAGTRAEVPTASPPPAEQTGARIPEKRPILPTLDQAKAYAPQSGIEPAAAEIWWLECEGRGISEAGFFRDGKGQDIHNWHAAMTSYGRKWQANDAQRTAAREKRRDEPKKVTL